MKIVQVFQPQRGSIRKISLQEKLTLSLNFDISIVETMQEGNDLLFVFSDGSIVLLEEFYSTKTPPMFLLANGEIVQSFEDMMASADADLPTVDTSTEGLTAEVKDVLSLPVAAGGKELSNGGLGEYRDGDGQIVGGIDRLGNIGYQSGGAGDFHGSFLGDNIGPTHTDASDSSAGGGRPAPGLGSVDTWKDIVHNTGGAGLGALGKPVEMFPQTNVGSESSYNSIKLTFGEGWNGNDKIYINGMECDPGKLPTTVTIGSISLKLQWGPDKSLLIQPASGSLTKEQVNEILKAFGYTNANIGNQNGIFDANSNDIKINFDFLKQLETGFKKLDITLQGDKGAESIKADIDFRELLNLGNTSTAGISTTVGVGSSSTQHGGSSSLSANKDWAIIGTQGNDSITINGQNNGRYHFVVGGAGNDSITASSNDNYFLVGNGTFDSVSGTVSALDGNGSNTIITGAGNDTIIGGKENDSINAGRGNNLILTGGSAANGGNAGQNATTVVLDTAGTNTIIMSGADASENLHIDGTIDNDIILSQSQMQNANKNDSIYISGNVNGGRIEVGGGNDTVHVHSNVSGGTINLGDGDDSVFVEGSMSGGNISSTNGKNTIQLGNDTAKSTMSGGAIALGSSNDIVSIFGDMSGGKITTGEGIDTIIVSGNVSGTASIHSGAWGDSIQVGSMSGGTISSGIGNDTVRVGTQMMGGLIDVSNGSANAGNSVHIGFENVNGGNIKDSTLTVLGGTATINSGDKNDTIQVSGHMNGATISAGAGDDSVLISGDMLAGLIEGVSGKNTITITGSVKGGASIHGGSGDDSITAKDVVGGTINGGDGRDTIHITGSVGIQGTSGCGTGLGTGLILGGAGDDVVTVVGNHNSGTINGGSGDDSVVIQGSMTGGTIQATEGKDTVQIQGQLQCGTIEFGSTGGQLEIGKHESDFTHNTTLKVDTNVVAMVGGVLNMTQANNLNAIIHGDMQGGNITLGSGVNTTKNTLAIHGSVGDKNTTNTVSAHIVSNGGNSIDIAGRVQNGASIVLNGEEQTGGDSISVGTHSSNVTNGFTDAMTGGVIDASGSSGKNTITLHSNMTGGSILGGKGNDAINVIGSMSGGSMSAGSGEDTITVKGTVSNATIKAEDGNDSLTVDSINAGALIDLGNGDDIISVSGGMSGGTISSGSGNDSITIKGMVSNATIKGEDGNDSISLENISGGALVDLGDGNDTVNIAGAMSGGLITAGSGNDSIFVTGLMSNATIKGESGNNTIEVQGGLSNATIEGGSDSDTIIVGTDDKTSFTSSSVISSGNGDDNITVKSNVNGGIIDGGAGNDKIELGKMTAGTVSGGIGNDNITIKELSGGNVYGDSLHATEHGSNTLSIDQMSGGNVYTGHGDSTLSLNTLSGGDIYTQGGSNTITIATMSGGTLHLAGESNLLNITTMSGGTINGSDGKDVVTIGAMSGGNLNLAGGIDTVTINAMSNATVNLGDNTNELKATITGANVTINTGGDNDKDVNTIILTQNAQDLFDGVTINGSAATDILDISSLGATTTIHIEKLPTLVSVELIKMGGAVLDLSSLTSHTASTKFGNNATLKVEITSWSQVQFGQSQHWTKVSDTTYKFSDGDKTLTIEFVAKDGSSIAGTLPVLANTSSSRHGDNDSVFAVEVNSPERVMHENAPIQAAAVAMALIATEAMHTEVKESTPHVEDKVALPMVAVESVVSPLPVIIDKEHTKENHVQTQNTEVPTEEVQSNILGTQQEQSQEDILVLGPEYVVQEPISPIDTIMEEDKEAFIAGEDIEAPIALQGETLLFPENMSEETLIVEPVDENKTEETFPLLPEEEEMQIEVAIGDLLEEHTSNEIPREEVEVKEELYNSVAGDTWYVSNVEVEEAPENKPYTIDETQGILFANQSDEAPVFTLEDANIAAFELVSPSMEMHYDEQVY